MFQRLFTVAALVTAIALPSSVLAADWRAMSEPEVGLTFTMPGEPRREVGELEDGDARPTIAYLYSSDDDGMFIVQVSQTTMDLEDPVAIGDTGVEVMKKELAGITVVSDEGTREGAVYRRVTIARQAGGGMAVQTTLVHNRTLVVALHLQAGGDELNADARRFLSALKVTPR